MVNPRENNEKHSGILSGVKARLRKNRLGELLVLDGHLSPSELKNALSDSRTSGQQLGHVLVSNNYVSRSVIQRTLAEQIMLRIVMTGMTVFIALASMGFAKKAKAGQVKDVPASISMVQASFNSVSQYPKLFGSTEKKSRSLKAFTKWTGMFERFDAAMKKPSSHVEINALKSDLASLQGLPLSKMVSRVNSIMNEKRYITDKVNYGKNDYWATPIEFLTKGGDCEDFAIAKYTALRMLGVPENRMRIAIVQDQQKNIPHAVLIVYTDQGAMILDNQIKNAVNASSIRHYKPIFSINQNAWWLHTAPRGNVTVVASAAR
ncbi:MAG: transglutaminase-like cysteine peptidase [Alphaproteobacteria bacterium]|nr:transglutaminase-like cysteine peptidase [Alphaproteobacteria bacterium]